MNDLFSRPLSQIPNSRPLTLADKRSRSEIREDFEKKLKAIDLNAIGNLKEKLLESDSEDLSDLKDDLENALIKFARFYNKFEDLNSEESRKLALKEQELRLETRHDWKEKFRLFLFRVLASALLICTLFTIGYVEHEYEWAKLPMSKYLNTTNKIP